MLRLLVLIGVVCGLGMSATAQESEKASIEGFRSAKWDMEAKEIREAIAKDFPSAAKAISENTHPKDKTMIIKIKVKDLLPDSGEATVSYILGYSSKKLIQVNVEWDGTKAERSENERIRGIVTALQSHFLGLGFDPAKVITNRVTKDKTFISFQGFDAKDRMVMLRAKLTDLESNEKDAYKGPPIARLNYALKAKDPDVFKIKPGQF